MVQCIADVIMLIYLICWRLLWSVLSQSWYVPDETWQSVEVSHNIVWGRGHLTWEHDEAIRSSLQSLPYTIIFFILSALHLDYQWLVVLTPKLFAAVLTAVGDYSLYNSVKRRDGGECASWFLMLTQTNWFLLYSGSRTVVNTMETALFSLGLSLYPRSRYLLVVSVSVMMRPTLIIPWSPLLVQHLYSTTLKRGVVKTVRMCVAPLIISVIVIVMDSLHYQRLTLTPLNFFRVNILHNLGSFYGTNPSYWYITNCLLPIIGPLLPASLYYFITGHQTDNIILTPVLASLSFFSLLEHKEMRFLQPVIPLIIYSGARTLSRWTRSHPSSAWFSLVCVLNLPLALYLSLVHQRGVVDAALWLGQQDNVSSAVFLMPCHSAPLYSHVHSDIQLQYLQCLPNFSNDSNYREEADVFYDNPSESFLQSYSHFQCIVIFDSLYDQMREAFQLTGHSLKKSFFHTHFPDGRVGSNVLILCETLK